MTASPLKLQQLCGRDCFDSTPAAAAPVPGSPTAAHLEATEPPEHEAWSEERDAQEDSHCACKQGRTGSQAGKA